jgi:hypothetical protein
MKPDTRQERDFYPTREAWVTETLLDHVDLGGLTVWEPAAGEGDMAKVLEASSAARVYCSDVTDRGYPLDAIHDFTAPISPAPELRFDAIVTNPPGGPRYTTAEAFIESGLRHIARGGLLALLLPTDFDSAGRRRPLFQNNPWFCAKIVLTRRIVWFERPDGDRAAPKENHAWYCWQRAPLRASRAPLTLYGPEIQLAPAPRRAPRCDPPLPIAPPLQSQPDLFAQIVPPEPGEAMTRTTHKKPASEPVEVTADLFERGGAK